MKNRKKMYIILFSLVFVVIVMSVGYAIMSTALNIQFGSGTNALTLKKEAWNVSLMTSGNNNGTASGSADTVGRSCGSLTVTANTITVGDTTLSKPGDKCLWTFKVKNSGTIDASLQSVSNIGPDGITCSEVSTLYTKMVCGNIAYRILTSSSDENSALKSGIDSSDVLPGEEKTYYIMAKYVGTNLNSSPVTHSGVSFKLNYVQG